MNPEEIKNIIELTLESEVKGYWVYVLITIVVACLVTFGTQFLTMKAKNYATKQDITELTKMIEKSKGEQGIRNQKRKELYDQTIAFRKLIYKFINKFK